MKTVEEWTQQIETQRIEDANEAIAEQVSLKNEYDSYISQYKTYSEEQMRDYGHTWGPGYEEEPKWVKELTENERVIGKQLDILKLMVKNGHPKKDIEYIFLNRNGLDDDYPINQFGEEYTYQDVLSTLLNKYRKETEIYEEEWEKQSILLAKKEEKLGKEKENPEFEWRLEMLKSFQTIITSLNNEEAFYFWVLGNLPDDPDEEDFEDCASDKKAFNAQAILFRNLMITFANDGFTSANFTGKK